MEPTDRVPFGKTKLTTTRLGRGSAPLGGLFNPVSDVGPIGGTSSTIYKIILVK